VLLGGLFGNTTISWPGWSQTAEHMLAGRLLTAYRQWRLFYRLSPYSRPTAFHKLLLEPLLPDRIGVWLDRLRNHGRPPWQVHSAIAPDFARATGTEARAAHTGHDFLYRARRGERAAALTPVDYVGDWQAAEKAVTGVEVRDPTADIDVVSYCFGVPPEQYLAEDIDRSLIRRAMWGLLPESVLANRLSGLQSADWYEKLAPRRAELAAEVAALATSPLARRAIDLPRLERAIAQWPTGDWHTSKIENEYHFAFTRGLATARFARWVEQSNRQS
jgi:asparagine synthase (glutamine-hydrolysing)